MFEPISAVGKTAEQVHQEIEERIISLKKMRETVLNDLFDLLKLISELEHHKLLLKAQISKKGE